jgi:two-component system OmpR family sensor kinase
MSSGCDRRWATWLRRGLSQGLRRGHRAELGWAAFAVACAASMLVFRQWQTVPFHFIWITVTLLYGYRHWSGLQTGLTLLGVVVVTTAAMLRTPVERAELSEIPLMACVFLAMVWHVRRRQDAVDAQRRAGEREHNFMRDAAHSLRTPLTVAHGHAELLRDELVPGTQTHDDAGVMLDELRRLARISDQLLMLSSAGHADALLLEPVSLGELADAAGRRWRAASGRSVEVDALDPVWVLGDQQRLRHALDALVENALNATGPGDRVTITARHRDQRAELVVADTGAGVAAADAEQIFERFFRGPCTGGRSGTGLGLPIVKAITEAHGGTVTLTGAPGVGATFTLSFVPLLPAGRPEQEKVAVR